MKNNQTKEELLVELTKIRQSHEEWVAEDLKRREEFARALGWNKQKNHFDYGEAELYEPTWIEIFVELGKLLSLRDFRNLEGSVSECKYAIQDIKNNLTSDNKTL